MRDALLAARERTLQLADAYSQALARAGMRVAYQPTINPPLWELGHIGWFQEWWVGRNRQLGSGISCEPDHARRESLLPGSDALYDSSRVAHRSRWELALPDAAGTRDYLGATLKQTLALLDRLPKDAGDPELYFFRLVALHEEMHAEAASYMARALCIPLPEAMPPARDLPVNTSLQLPAQEFRLGYGGAGFAFDNELGAHELSLNAFEIDSQPVSWSRFMPFVEAGGYVKPRFWSAEGWAWVEQAQAAPPAPAVAESELPAAHLNAYEAQAWCAWAGRRLPTEAEWECAAVTAADFTWGSVWEWTASTFLPYPGFAPHPYRDYSAPWFGSRRVLRGACHATSPSLAHPRYRNFFEPHRKDVFGGFRSCA